MAVWLRKDYGRGSYSEVFDRLEKLLTTTGRHQEILMVAERGEVRPLEMVVYIWFANENLAALFPEFERSERPSSPRPIPLISDARLYEQIFPNAS